MFIQCIVHLLLFILLKESHYVYAKNVTPRNYRTSYLKTQKSRENGRGFCGASGRVVHPWVLATNKVNKRSENGGIANCVTGDGKTSQISNGDGQMGEIVKVLWGKRRVGLLCHPPSLW